MSTLSPCRKSRATSPSQVQLISNLTPVNYSLIALVKVAALICLCHTISVVQGFCCLGCEHLRRGHYCAYILPILEQSWYHLSTWDNLSESLLFATTGWYFASLRRASVATKKKVLPYRISIPHNSCHCTTWFAFSPSCLLLSHSFNPLLWKSISLRANIIIQGNIK